MGRYLGVVFSCCLAISLCSVISRFSSASSLTNQSDLVNTKNNCQKYMTYEDCMKEAYELAEKCRTDSSQSQLTIDNKNVCDEYEKKLKSLCSAHCAKASCLDCYDKMEKFVENCQLFSKKINCGLNDTTQRECEDMKVSFTKYCSSKECQACKDLYCRNGGKCAGSNAVWCTCQPGFTGAFCHKSQCANKPCKNGGTCVGENLCKCPPLCSGSHCTRKRLGTKDNPVPNAQAILDAGDSVGSDMYWIQPPGETAPAQTYCDMSFAGGALMLASYGYVQTTGVNSNNKSIPNMNNPFGFAWLPIQRSSSHGVISLPHGAIMMANNARYMIMAAGNNPATGGINEYAYVYRIYLKNNPYNITFANHNRYNGGQPGRMHIVGFVVEALKGESETYGKYALGEALGVTWADSHPTGYGFNDNTTPYGAFYKGPFFPSVHSGSGRKSCSGCTPTNYQPDVVGGNPRYTHRGWYTANGVDKTGQTSIWFK